MPDEYGNVTSGSWSDFLTVWGALEVERGRERLEAGRLESAVGGILRVRSTPETRQITAADRAVLRDQPWQIRSITNPDGRNEMLEMVVERGVAA